MTCIFDKEYDIRDREPVVHENMQDPPLPKIKIKNRDVSNESGGTRSTALK